MFSSIQAVSAVSSIPEGPMVSSILGISMVSTILGVAMSANFPGNRPMFGGRAFPRRQLLTPGQKLKIKPIFTVSDSTNLAADNAGGVIDVGA